MLPIITIGLTEPARVAVERIPGGRELTHFSDAEQAAWAAGGDPDNGVPSPYDAAPDGRAEAHVIYGDAALGKILTEAAESTVPTRLRAVGAVIVATDSLGDDPLTPVRVVSGSAEERAVTRSAIEAVSMLQARALIVVDQLSENPSWAEAIARVLDSAEGEPHLIDNPGGEAAAELRRAEALHKLGQHRPDTGMFR